MGIATQCTCVHGPAILAECSGTLSTITGLAFMHTSATSAGGYASSMGRKAPPADMAPAHVHVHAYTSSRSCRPIRLVLLAKMVGYRRLSTIPKLSIKRL